MNINQINIFIKSITTEHLVTSLHNNNINNHRNQMLNLLKGIACIGVVFIHFVFPGVTGIIIKNLSKFAVPCFFMIAGYYAFGCNCTVVKRRLIKIIKILLYAYIIWFIFYLFIHLFSGDVILWVENLITFKVLFNFIVFCSTNFAYLLWYLVAMAETYILWVFVVKHGKEKSCLKLLPILFISRFICVSYIETNAFSWHYKTIFLISALPWFVMGYCIHLNQQKILNKLGDNTLLAFLIIGCVILLFPILHKTSINFSCIGVFIYSVVLFIFAMKYEDVNVPKIVSYIGDKLSLNIYILHPLVANLIHYINVLILHINNVVFISIKPIVIAIATLLTAHTIQLFREKLKFNPFQYKNLS